MNQIFITEFALSKHAIARAQQRCIRMTDIQEISIYGRPYHAGSGIYAYHVGRREVKHARLQGIRIDHLLDKAILIKLEIDGTFVVLTVQHSSNIPKHWHPARSVG